MKKLVMHSGGMDSLALMLEYVDKYGAANIISLGFNYGQRHFFKENAAAHFFCKAYNIKRVVLDIPLGQIGGCSLTDHTIPVTTDMAQQRTTVVPMRNGVFLMLAAAVAQVEECDTIVHGACYEDQESYRDCRPEFFQLMEYAIQAGITNPTKGSEQIADDVIASGETNTLYTLKSDAIDIHIDTPLAGEKKEDTMARVLKTHPVSVYKYSYTCYVGGAKQCGKCPACRERLQAFAVNNVIDPVEYEENII